LLHLRGSIAQHQYSYRATRNISNNGGMA